MSEKSRDIVPGPQNPEQTNADLIAFCDEVLDLKGKVPDLTRVIDVTSYMEAESVQARLRQSSLGDLMFVDGDSLAAPETSINYADKNFFVGKAKLSGVELRIFASDRTNTKWNQEYPRKQVKSNSISTGERNCWERKLSIALWYASGTSEACQIITVESDVYKSASLPDLSRTMSGLDYNKEHYIDHNYISRPAQSDQEVMEFLELAREIFEASPYRQDTYSLPSAEEQVS